MIKVPRLNYRLLIHTCNVLEEVVVADEYAAPSRSFKTLSQNNPCLLLPQSQSDTNAARDAGAASHRVAMNWPGHAVVRGNILLFGERRFEVKSVVDALEQQVWLEIDCLEIV